MEIDNLPTLIFQRDNYFLIKNKIIFYIPGLPANNNIFQWTTATWSKCKDYGLKINYIYTNGTVTSSKKSTNTANILDELFNFTLKNLELTINNISLTLNDDFLFLNGFTKNYDLRYLSSDFDADLNCTSPPTNAVSFGKFNYLPDNEDFSSLGAYGAFMIPFSRIFSFFDNDNYLPPNMNFKLTFNYNYVNLNNICGVPYGGIVTNTPNLTLDNYFNTSFNCTNLYVYYKEYIFKESVKKNPIIWDYFNKFYLIFNELKWDYLKDYQLTTVANGLNINDNILIQGKIPEYLMILNSYNKYQKSISRINSYTIQYSLAQNSLLYTNGTTIPQANFSILGTYNILRLQIKADNRILFDYDIQTCFVDFQTYLNEMQPLFLPTLNRNFLDKRHPLVIQLYNKANSTLFNDLDTCQNLKIKLYATPSNTINGSGDPLGAQISPIIFGSSRKSFALDKNLNFTNLPSLN